MNKHHGELIQQFQQLMDIRNELKESLDTAKITSKNENKLPCLIEVDQWERKTIEYIREIARKVRTNINETMAKNMAEIRHQLEQLSTHMQQQEKEGNYLENDIGKVKFQLDQLKETIQRLNEKIQVVTSSNIDWNALIHISTDKNTVEDDRNSTKYFMQDKASINQEKQLNAESSSRSHDRQSIFRPMAPLPLPLDNSKAFRPISSPILSHEDSSDSERNSPLIGPVTAVDRTVPMLSTQRPVCWKELFKHNPNT
jgi:chromosome segregation ATPase